ncbi:hypothetical protein F0562_034361 [Nyssa sinensis]|uniref:PHD-type domain-containing protein n=1 Tax=Nyssa sinensis TaxID=561372 RepID=A0A5J5AFI9_9ASTE|nr:hypothetical protein F0562_034361 [Nyssa sinensis]
METTNLEPCKYRKRKPKLFGFHSFPNTGSMIGMCGHFRDNIRLLLQECGEIQDYSVSGMPVWSTLLVSENNGIEFSLYIIEESVQHSLRPCCDHCKCVGWSHHFVSKRRYHMIIPLDDNLNRPLNKDSFELHTHLLHGVIHCNGFGHLLCINGIEEDPNYLEVSHIMDLWDRMCTTLQTRKISVNDVSKQGSMEMRLLHCVAYGHSWFGKWGYKFGHESFGVTEQKYNIAIQTLCTLKLDKIANDFNNTGKDREIQHLIRSYREVSQTQLVTISDLLQFILSFKSTAPIQRKTTTAIVNNASSKPSVRQHECQTLDKPISSARLVSLLANTDCRWPKRRLGYAIEVIVNVLKVKKAATDGKSTMSRQDLREAARQYIGDTGLLDFVLKSIKSFTVDNQIVHRSINPSTKLLEFTIHDDVNRAESSTESTTFLSSSMKSDSKWSDQRLEHAAEVVLNTLKENKAMLNGRSAMSREELRVATRLYIGDTGLIDFVLKSIDNSVFGDQIIFRIRNPSTKLIEFAIRDIIDQPEDGKFSDALALEPGLDPYEDVLFLYENVILGYSMPDSVCLATRVVLDIKHFVKEWLFKGEEINQQMTLTCRVLPSYELESEFTRPLPPGELFVVPPRITIGELKGVVQCALRDTYCVMGDFVVKQIGGLRMMDEEKELWCAVESGAHVWVRGRGLDLGTKLRYEGGADNWRVNCVCGARDDDGERMVACDGCQVWKHTRCSDINDDEAAPMVFLCANCRS